MKLTRVYFNLHKRKLSIQEKRINDSGKLVWKVVRHADFIFLKDAKFKVSEAGRQKVIKEKKKNVHAFVVGYTLESPKKLLPLNTQVFYNPYKFSSFVDGETNPIFGSELVLIQGSKVGYKILCNK